jgi:putative membrane protein
MTRLMMIAAVGAAAALAACSSGPSGDQAGARASSDQAGQQPGYAEAMNGTVSDMDRKFVKEASCGGTYEVQAGQLAEQKTNDAHVRMIAQHMIRDHTAANRQLSELASKEGLMASDSPNGDQQRMIGTLQGLNGTEFDQEYIKQQTQAHKETIALFQKEVIDGSDSALKGWAANTLPTLDGHLRMITGESNVSSEQP